MQTNRLGLVVVALLGVVAMHGVGSHGVHSAESVPLVMAHGASHSERVLGETLENVMDQGPADHRNLGIDALCVAILVGFGFALRRLSAARSWISGFGQSGWPRDAGWPRVRDPSSLTLAGSILRC